jgi:hypothetical protein
MKPSKEKKNEVVSREKENPKSNDRPAEVVTND